MSKVVITGAAGFVGKKLVDCLISIGYDVIALDKVDPKVQGLEFRKIDLTNASDIEKIELPIGAIVIHLAAMSTDSLCKSDPVGAMQNNLVATASVVQIANKFKASKFVFASSEWVYPELDKAEVQSETMALSLTNLNSLYAMSKLMGENLVRVTTECMHVILRFGIVYGPRSNPGSAPESILAKVNHGDKVSVGSFNTARRFVFVEDLVAAITALVSDPGDLNGEIYNVSGPDLVSLGEIASISMEILEKKVEIEDGGLTPSIRNPDPSKFNARFDFIASFGIRDGLVACLNARN